MSKLVYIEWLSCFDSAATRAYSEAEGYSVNRPDPPRRCDSISYLKIGEGHRHRETSANLHKYDDETAPITQMERRAFSAKERYTKNS